MERLRLLRTFSIPLDRVHLRRLAAAAVWICSVSAVAAAQTASKPGRDLARAPGIIVDQSWCEVRVPADAAPASRALTAANPLDNPMDQPYFAAASESTKASAPLQLAGESTSPLVALVADIRGTTRAAATSGDLENNTIAIQAIHSQTSTPTSGTEPALWAIGAIALCGLGLAGLSAPLFAARLTPMRKGWRS